MEKPTGKHHCHGLECGKGSKAEDQCGCLCDMCMSWNEWLSRQPLNSGDFSIGSKVWPGMSKLIEEMGELGQVLGKIMGTGGEAKHWDGSNLRERVVEELADVYAAVLFFVTQNLTHEERVVWSNRVGAKLVLFNKWHAGGTHGVVR